VNLFPKSTPPFQMFSFFKSTPKPNQPNLAENPLFTVLNKGKDNSPAIYKCVDAPTFPTKIKAKKVVNTFTYQTTEEVGKSDVSLLGIIPLATITQTKTVNNTSELSKIRLEMTPEMSEFVDRILCHLRGKEILNKGTFRGTMTPEEEAGAPIVVRPIIVELRPTFAYENGFYAINWMKVKPTA
jgi:hypothetical protein